MKTLQFMLFIAVVFVITVCSVSGQEDLQEDEVHIGSYGYTCTSECRKKGYSYNWCYASHPTSKVPGITYWDYCSKHQEHDHRGRRCWHEHACGNHGYDYKWCYTGEDGSSWGYCGLNVKKRKNE
ncbi:unnamed protein product [Orchesella dallaii]|uniref:Uncharacterized protein n=1 Tax=Orchesella dallaii TaxID=48710 RepID=A0ABP1PRW1_9HEXA